MTPEERAAEIINGFKHGKTTTWTHLGTTKQMVHDSEIIPLIATAIREAVAAERARCAKILASESLVGGEFEQWLEVFNQ